jgi:hypothetical protein
MDGDVRLRCAHRQRRWYGAPKSNRCGNIDRADLHPLLPARPAARPPTALMMRSE